MKVCILTVLFAFLFTTIAAGEAPPSPDFVTQVAPILQTYCAGCHNPDEKEGGLSFESFADLQQGGEHGPALIAGQADASRMWLMLTGKIEPKMPPEDNESPNAEELSILKAWIDGGAKGPDGAEPDHRVLIVPQLPSAPQAERTLNTTALSPDGTKLAAGTFQRVVLIDAQSGQILQTIGDLAGKVNSVTFSNDGNRLIVASGVAGLYGQATIFNVADGTRIREFVGHRDTMYDAELSPDGMILATCSYDRKIILWNSESGEQLRSLDGHNGAVFDVAFHPQGAVLASASADETVKLWRVDSGERLDTLSQPGKEQYVTVFSPDGNFVLGAGADNRIRVWQFVSREQPQINPILYARFAHEGAITRLAFSRDGQRLVSAAEDGTLKLWETSSYTEVHLYETQPELIVGAAFSVDGSRVHLARMDGQIQQLDVPASANISSAPASGVSTSSEMPTTPPMDVADQEPNDEITAAQSITLPARVTGAIHASAGDRAADVDTFRFEARAGQKWVLEVNAARKGSPLDSRIEVVDANGKPIERVLLQAVRDAYFTFRGKDSDTSDDFRLQNWEEMELNEYLYANGEVVKLWLYPRGPDSGFKVYPGVGQRYTYFDTTATSHPLHETCYIVQPQPPGTTLIPNGLPVFPVYFENDDDGWRQWGADSRLTFTAPTDGAYYVRVTDVRGFQGEPYKYELLVRPEKPDFNVTIEGSNPTVNAGSGKEFTIKVERLDGYEGEIRIDVENVPPGFFVTSPIVIQAGQISALGTIYARGDAAAPAAEVASASRIKATATIDGQEIIKEVSNLGEIKLGAKPNLLVRVVPTDKTLADEPALDQWKPWELTIAPGQTITAKVIVERNGNDGPISFGNEDSGRNMPHGVFVDNIGLNGLLIVEGASEREFFITAGKWVPDQTRLFHLRAKVEGGDGDQTSWPVILNIKR